MTARIYRPAPNAMQSGKAKSQEWLLEFESATPRTVDPLMAWRLLRYMARIWERALVERGGTELPYLVPMVLYKGERRWTVSDRFEALFPHGNAELTEALLPYADVQKSDDPDRMLGEFLQSAYEAAADLAKWDRPMLEREPVAP